MLVAQGDIKENKESKILGQKHRKLHKIKPNNAKIWLKFTHKMQESYCLKFSHSHTFSKGLESSLKMRIKAT